MDKEVEEEAIEEENSENLPNATTSDVVEFKDSPQTGDNAVSNTGDEAYLKKIEKEEDKENKRIEEENDSEELSEE